MEGVLFVVVVDGEVILRSRGDLILGGSCEQQTALSQASPNKRHDMWTERV